MQLCCGLGALAFFSFLSFLDPRLQAEVSVSCAHQGRNMSDGFGLVENVVLQRLPANINDMLMQCLPFGAPLSPKCA